ncbi:hypothetical protein RGU74_27005 [Bacillus cereus]|uniref:hypothetical protein n=1 Tax=Bacillus cereus TaxID=1396 RepID=UPI0028532313|nr:hypothetical protein [Bacillus cereus]MDR4987148.1 hypothetical protein [Bacillus cereus]
MPYLEHHFNHRKSSENLYPHNVGSSAFKMWDLRLLIPGNILVNKGLQKIYEGRTVIPHTLKMSVCPPQNLGVFKLFMPGIQTVELYLIDMKKMQQITIVSESLIIPNTSPAQVGGMDFGTFINGDVVIANYARNTMKLYDKKGVFKKSVSGIVGAYTSSTDRMWINGKKGIIFIADQNRKQFRVYNKNLELIFVISHNDFSLSSSDVMGMYQNGDILLRDTSGTGFTRVYIDYVNQKLLKIIKNPSLDNMKFLGIRRDATYFAKGTNIIVEVNNEMTIVSENTPNGIYGLVKLDDDYLYTIGEETGGGGMTTKVYTVFDRKTNQIAYQEKDFSNNPGIFDSLKGDEATYGTYW